ncbi:MAG: hypothetical protein LQ352_004456 [Teloschistes flavicans]|nr:MAG: hypothetical protein LQ352_004456 [Teloschistes flavicans]
MSESPIKMYALAAVLSLLAIVATVLRFYARHIKKAGYSWDDMVLLPALAVYATNLTTVLTFGFTKLAVLFFYQRLFQGRWVQMGIWIMVGVTFVWTVGFFFSELLQCVPISANWKGFGYDPAACGVNANIMIMAQTWSDIATNVVILLLPIHSIWALQMPPRRKLAVCGIFLLGFLTVGAGIAKLAVYYDMLGKINSDPNAVDVTWIQTPLVYWPLVESSCGIIGACLPLMRPLFAGAASRGFMRDLQSVDIPTSERSDTLWNKSEQRAVDDWNSMVSTVRYGSDSLAAGEHLKEKKMPSLPNSSLDMLKDTPTQGLWIKQPRVPYNMV